MSATSQPAHYKLGPSTMKRSLNCPGWVHLAAQAPKPVPSKYAAEGTLAHHIAAEILKQHFFDITPSGSHDIGTKYYVTKDDNAKVSNSKPKTPYFEFRIDEEMLAAIGEYVDFCIEQAQGVSPANIWVEERVHIPSEIGKQYPEWTLGGTADFIVLRPYDRLVVVDYKHGAGTPVSVIHNEQGMSYGLGALHTSIDKYDRSQISQVDIVIVQPRGLGNGVSVWSTDVESIFTVFHGELLAMQRRIVVDKDTTTKAGEWCKFCPAEPICTTTKAYIGNGLSISWDDLQEIQLPVVADFDIKKLVAAYEMKKRLNDYIDMIESHLFSITEKGEVDTGYEIVSTLKNAEWANETQIKAFLADIEEPISLYTDVIKTPAAIDREITAINQARKKAGRKDLVTFNKDSFTIREVGKAKLVKKKPQEKIDAKLLTHE